MAVTPIEPMVPMKIGCDHMVWAPLTKDDGLVVTYGAVVALPGTMSIGINPNMDMSSAFYDDGPGEVATTLGQIEVNISKASLGTKEKATLLGHGVDTNGVLIYGAEDVPPWGALGFRTLQSDGTYRYVWMLKGKFMDPAETNETKGESISFQNDEIVGKFVKVNKEYTYTDAVGTKEKKVRPWKVEVNEATGAEVAPVIAEWFTAPVLPDATLV